MTKTMAKVGLISLLSLTFAAGPAALMAQEKAPDAAARAYPFRGKLAAVDKDAKTITLEGAEAKRTIHITATTKVEKAGKPATLSDAVVGEQVTGSCKKTADGKEEAASLYLGPRAEGGASPPAAQ